MANKLEAEEGNWFEEPAQGNMVDFADIGSLEESVGVRKIVSIPVEGSDSYSCSCLLPLTLISYKHPKS